MGLRQGNALSLEPQKLKQNKTKLKQTSHKYSYYSSQSKLTNKFYSNFLEIETLSFSFRSPTKKDCGQLGDYYIFYLSDMHNTTSFFF